MDLRNVGILHFHNPEDLEFKFVVIDDDISSRLETRGTLTDIKFEMVMR